MEVTKMMTKEHLRQLVKYVRKQLLHVKSNNIGISLVKLTNKDFDYLEQFFKIGDRSQFLGYVHFYRKD